MKKYDKACLLFKANEIIRWLSADEVNWIRFKVLGIPDDCKTIEDMEEFTNDEDFIEIISYFIALMYDEIVTNYDYKDNRGVL